MDHKKKHRGPFFLATVCSCFLFICGYLLTTVSAYGDLRSQNPVVIVVQKVSDAVVNVSSEKEVQSSSNPFSGVRQEDLPSVEMGNSDDLLIGETINGKN